MAAGGVRSGGRPVLRAVPRDEIDMAGENTHLVEEVLRWRPIRKFIGRQWSEDDLRSWGYEGLFSAVRTWSPDRGSFAEYARTRIAANIRSRVWRAQGKHLRVSPPTVHPWDFDYLFSNEHPVGDEGHEIMRLMATPPQVSTTEQREAVEEVLSHLTPQQAKVAWMLAEDMTLGEVSEELGVSKARVYDIRRAAERRLREAGYSRPPKRCVGCFATLAEGRTADAARCPGCRAKQHGTRRHSRRPVQPCGTYAAWMRHYRLGEEPCEPCKAAASEYSAAYRASKRKLATAA